ncbi:MAG TPA: redoxin domain-containing protein [Hanamia sp.]|nr:redoxin domain-containing protein [Hanamia sp.]
MNPKKKLKFSYVVIILFYLATYIFSFSGSAQTLPAFKMKLSNGKIFSSSEVSPHKPLIIIYFAPDCEHCQILMNGIFKRINEFKNAEILMATFESDASVAGFVKQYQTAKYPNIKVGIEIPVFFFRKYYQLEHTPFTALFDKKQKLIVSYKDYTPLDDLIKHLKIVEKK